MEDEEEGELVKDPPSFYWSRWEDKKGYLHRLNGPAIIFSSGDTIWCRHGLRHRDDGPAVDWPSQNKEEWYKDGKVYEPSAHELIAWKMKKQNDTAQHE